MKLIALIAAFFAALLAFPLTASSATSAPLLPGETATSQGVPSYDFGTNDTFEFGSPNITTLPAVQTDIKNAGLTLMREWQYASSTGATDLARMKVVKNTGTTCLFELGQTNNLTWLKGQILKTEATCHLYEFGNEPDNGNSPAQGKISVYTHQWLTDIPQLRALDPNALFGGPVVMWSDSKDASAGSYPSDMAYFLAKTAAAGVRADFIDYHNYNCQAGKEDTEAACLANVPGDIAWNYNEVVTNEKTYYGAVIPTGLSEYGFDSGDQHLYDWGGDETFMAQYQTAAINAIVATGMSFATQFDSMNWGGYGNYDMFWDAAPYAPRAAFNSLAAAVQQYK